MENNIKIPCHFCEEETTQEICKDCAAEMQSKSLGVTKEKVIEFMDAKNNNNEEDDFSNSITEDMFVSMFADEICQKHQNMIESMGFEKLEKQFNKKCCQCLKKI